MPLKTSHTLVSGVIDKSVELVTFIFSLLINTRSCFVVLVGLYLSIYFLVPVADTITLILAFDDTLASGTLILNFSPLFNEVTSLLFEFKITVPFGAFSKLIVYVCAFVTFALNSFDT